MEIPGECGSQHDVPMHAAMETEVQEQATQQESENTPMKTAAGLGEEHTEDIRDSVDGPEVLTTDAHHREMDRGTEQPQTESHDAAEQLGHLDALHSPNSRANTAGSPGGMQEGIAPMQALPQDIKQTVSDDSHEPMDTVEQLAPVPAAIDAQHNFGVQCLGSQQTSEAAPALQAALPNNQDEKADAGLAQKTVTESAQSAHAEAAMEMHPSYQTQPMAEDSPVDTTIMAAEAVAPAEEELDHFDKTGNDMAPLMEMDTVQKADIMDLEAATKPLSGGTCEADAMEIDERTEQREQTGVNRETQEVLQEGAQVQSSNVISANDDTASEGAPSGAARKAVSKDAGPPPTGHVSGDAGTGAGIAAQQSKGGEKATDIQSRDPHSPRAPEPILAPAAPEAQPVSAAFDAQVPVSLVQQKMPQQAESAWQPPAAQSSGAPATEFSFRAIAKPAPTLGTLSIAGKPQRPGSPVVSPRTIVLSQQWRVTATPPARQPASSLQKQQPSSPAAQFSGVQNPAADASGATPINQSTSPRPSPHQAGLLQMPAVSITPTNQPTQSAQQHVRLLHHPVPQLQSQCMASPGRLPAIQAATSILGRLPQAIKVPSVQRVTHPSASENSTLTNRPAGAQLDMMPFSPAGMNTFGVGHSLDRASSLPASHAHGHNGGSHAKSSVTQATAVAALFPQASTPLQNCDEEPVTSTQVWAASQDPAKTVPQQLQPVLAAVGTPPLQQPLKEVRDTSNHLCTGSMQLCAIQLISCLIWTPNASHRSLV
jgi:hypothetical protein